MASVEPYVHIRADGSSVQRYKVRRRVNGKQVSRSFETREDAELFAGGTPATQGRRPKQLDISRIIDAKVAEALKRHHEAQQANDTVRPDGRPKLGIGAAVDRFLQMRREGYGPYPPAAPETVKNYDAWLSHTRSFFAGCFVEDITREDARRFRAYCDNPDLGRRANIGIYSTTITLWNMLIGLDVVSENTFQMAVMGLKLKTRARHDAAAKFSRDVYQYDEAYDIWTWADSIRSIAGSPLHSLARSAGARTSPMLKLLLATGMRRSEVCGIKMDAFQFNRRMLVVRSTVLGNGRESTVKSANSFRTILLHQDVADAIQFWIEEERRRFLGKDVQSDYIFPAADGAPLAGNNFYIVVQRTFAANKLTLKSLHAFRHMVTSVLVECGVDDVRIIKTLGHDNVEFSRQHYGHLMNHDGDPAKRNFIQERCVASAGLTLEKLRTLAA